MSCFIQHALQTEKRDLRQPSHVAYGKTLLVHLVHLLPWKALSSLLCHVQVSNRILHFRITSYSQQCVGRLHSFPFSPPLRFGLLAISEASSNIKIEASRLTSLEFWLVCNIWLTYWTGRERRLFCFQAGLLAFWACDDIGFSFLKRCAIWRKNWEFSKGPPSSLSKLLLLYISHFDLEARLIGRNNNKQYRSSLYIEGIWEKRNKKLVLCDILSNQGHTLTKVISPQ